MRTDQRAFVDSNVFLYDLEPNESAKSSIASELLDDLGALCVVSVQVLQEVYSVATCKELVPPSRARAYVEKLGTRNVVSPSQKTVLLAIDTSERYRINFYDAMIIEAAVAGKCQVLYTEDLGHGQVIRGVRIENPFAKV